VTQQIQNKINSVTGAFNVALDSTQIIFFELGQIVNEQSKIIAEKDEKIKELENKLDQQYKKS
jgi:hypothetical protein